MFMNGPTRGQDVFMPLDFIIGGPAMAGQGWRMLMECLAAGRSISLPSSNTGMSKLTARAVGARVRSQFRTPVGKFEGVEEALARIGGHTYMMDAARSMTAGAVDLGEKPSVVSAIVKYHVTERARQVVNDGMDVIGGKGICLGPSNFLGRAYQQIPIGITVEGANILTRSLIIFGQGAIRCHPYVLAEMQAAQSSDRQQGLHDFDRAFWGHVGFVVKNKLRALGTALTGARLVGVNADVAPEMKRYYQQLSRYSAAFALLADTSMLVLGGSLKRRERLSARLGDILSQMYLISATLKRYQDEGRQAADAPLAHWSIQDALFRLQEAFDGVLENYPNRFVAWGLRRIVFPWGHPQSLPSDELGQQVAKLLINPGAARDRLTAGCHLPATADEPVGAIELALAATLEAEPIEAKIRELEKRGALDGNPQANVRDIADAAYAAGGLTDEEYAVVKRRNTLRDTVVKVDDFPSILARARSVRRRAPGRMSTKDARMAFKPVYVVDGSRTPFLKARTGPGPFRRATWPCRPGARCCRQPFSPTDVDEVIIGCAAPSPDEVNIGRVIALRLGCGNRVPGWTVMRNCASGMQALDSAIANIQSGRSQLVVAGGVDALSRAPLLFSDDMVRWLSGWYAARGLGALSALRRFKLRNLAPVIGLLKGLTDPVVGLSMGQTAENVATRFGIDRAAMDAYSAGSHQRALAARRRRPGRDRADHRRQGHALSRGRRRARRLHPGKAGQAQARVRQALGQHHRRQQLAGHRRRGHAGAGIGRGRAALEPASAGPHRRQPVGRPGSGADVPGSGARRHAHPATPRPGPE